MCACTDMDDWGNWNDSTKSAPPPARRMPSRQASSVSADSAPDPAMSTSQPNAADDWEALLNAGQHHVQHATPKLPIASRPAPSTAFMQPATGAGKLQRKAPGAPAAPNPPAATNTASVQTVQNPYLSQPLLSKSATMSVSEAVNQIGPATKPVVLGRTAPAKPALSAQRFSKLPPGDKTLGVKPQPASPSPPAVVSAASQLSSKDISSVSAQKMRTNQDKRVPPAEKPEAPASAIQPPFAKPIASKLLPQSVAETAQQTAATMKSIAKLTQGRQATTRQELTSSDVSASAGKASTVGLGQHAKSSLAPSAAVTAERPNSSVASMASPRLSAASDPPQPSVPLPKAAATPMAFSRPEMTTSQRRMRLGLSAKPPHAPAVLSSQASATQLPSNQAPSIPAPSNQALPAHALPAQPPPGQSAGKPRPAIPASFKSAAADALLPTAGLSVPSGVSMAPKVPGLSAKLPSTSASARHISAVPPDRNAVQLKARQAVPPAAISEGSRAQQALLKQPKPVNKAEQQAEAASSADISTPGTHVAEPNQSQALAEFASESVAKPEAASSLSAEANGLQTLAQGSEQPLLQPARSLQMPAQAPGQKAVPSLPQQGRSTQTSAPAQTPTAAPSLPQTAQRPGAATQAQAAATLRPSAASKQAASLSAPTAPLLKPPQSHALPAVADTSTADPIAEGWSITLSPVMCPDKGQLVFMCISG